MHTRLVTPFFARTAHTLLAATVLALSLSPGCKGASKGLDYPGTEAGAKALLTDLMKPDADREAMTQALKPQPEDYAAYFEGDAAGKAKKGYEKLWSDPKAVISPKDGQTELLLWTATTDDLKAGKGNAREFPGGYKKVADKLKPGVTVVRFKFVKPGKKLGMAFDGLAYVNGHWAFFPKPWRVLR